MKLRNQPFFFLCFLLLHFSLSGCNKTTDSKSDKKLETRYYAPKYAQNFSVVSAGEKQLHLKIFTATDTLIYFLNAGVASTKERDNNLITIPIKKGVFFSTTHLSYLHKLQALSVVNGFSKLDFISIDTVKEQLLNQNITEVGEEFSFNNEVLTVLETDVIVSSGFSENSPIIATPVLPIVEWKESHPLGRAEWIVVFGLLTGKFEESIVQFQEIERKYNALKKLLASDTTNMPTALVGFPYQGQWYAPGGDSFMSVFLKDARVNYPWRDIRKSGSVVISFEEVYNIGINAPYWIIAGQVPSLSTVLSTDERFRDFEAFQQKRVFNNDKVVNTKGWNAYYETSVLFPHEVLADFIQIFHPEFFPERELYYHRALPDAN